MIFYSKKPTIIGEDLTGSECFELMRAAVTKQVEQAEFEVGRLARMVKADAAMIREDASDVSIGIPSAYSSQRLDNSIALQVARGQLAAAKQVWLSVHQAICGPSISATTQEAVDKGMAEFRARRRDQLDRWKETNT